MSNYICKYTSLLDKISEKHDFSLAIKVLGSKK